MKLLTQAEWDELQEYKAMAIRLSAMVPESKPIESTNTVSADLDIKHVSHIEFDSLPDSALVTIDAFRTLAGIAPSTVWRRASLEPDFPQPVRLGAKCTRFKVGDIRRLLAGKVPA